MTVSEALNVQQRTVSSREAEVLLANVLGKSREQLHTHPETLLMGFQASNYERSLLRREQNEPVAYIVGHKEFYGRRFATDKRALIPRPETEALIDLAVSQQAASFQASLRTTGKPCPRRILELGTGSGNIALTLAHEYSLKGVPIRMTATDIDERALMLAQENATALTVPSLTQLKWVQADLFDSLEVTHDAPYDLVVANLPYVPTTWRQDSLAQKEVLFYEPDVALFGGETGTDIYRRFWRGIPLVLHAEGQVLIEFDHGQADVMLAYAQAALPDYAFSVFTDYAGLERILQGLPLL